jgi:hypothetical protein
LAGQSYTAGALTLNDSQARFCLAAGKQPIAMVNLAVGNQPIIGAPPASTSQLDIANIPAASVAATYDVLIQTYPNCGDTPTVLTMPGAIQYQ